jgi:AraC family transcriptional regulator, regulatory protein of adaptative response / methylated-DNA-[protein]-cysteine methyltransferase
MHTITSTTPSTTDDQRWESVRARDHNASGAFVFAVRTTGIYCRPACPARQPLRRNVVFYDTPDDAERAGYRPCKRCHPREQSLSERNAGLVAHACRTIESAAAEPALADLAGAAGMSPHHFHRIFRSVTGLTPKAYAAAHRARKVRQSLPAAPSVTYAIYDAGFGSNGGFYTSTPEMLGMTPSRYRANGSGMRIRFAIGESSLGSVLVAATDRGICSILMGNDPDALVRQLQDRFTNADLIGGDAAFENLIATVIGFIEAPQTGLDLPLDVRGSAFQHRVWQALREIPAGTTMTYSDIAAKIGSPRATRAVAQACASNGIAVAIPCHRVVRKNGDLAGYRWGIERKRELLTRESSL